MWAVAQAGFRAVIAPGKGEGFADIFEGNAYNNGLLPIELADDDWKALASADGSEATIDLRSRTVSLHTVEGVDRTFEFDVPEENRQRLLQGLDFIAETLLHDEEIARYEAAAPAWAMAPSAG